MQRAFDLFTRPPKHMRMLVDTAEKVNKSGLLDNTDPAVVLQRLRQVKPLLLISHVLIAVDLTISTLYLYNRATIVSQSCHNTPESKTSMQTINWNNQVPPGKTGHCCVRLC